MCQRGAAYRKPESRHLLVLKWSSLLMRERPVWASMLLSVWLGNVRRSSVVITQPRGSQAVHRAIWVSACPIARVIRRGRWAVVGGRSYARPHTSQSGYDILRDGNARCSSPSTPDSQTGKREWLLRLQSQESVAGSWASPSFKGWLNVLCSRLCHRAVPSNRINPKT